MLSPFVVTAKALLVYYVCNCFRRAGEASAAARRCVPLGVIGDVAKDKLSLSAWRLASERSESRTSMVSVCEGMEGDNHLLLWAHSLGMLWSTLFCNSRLTVLFSFGEALRPKEAHPRIWTNLGLHVPSSVPEPPLDVDVVFHVVRRYAERSAGRRGCWPSRPLSRPSARIPYHAVPNYRYQLSWPSSPSQPPTPA